jgi:DNA polymerase
MIVGEAPGEDEDLTGLPFVGRAGKLLETTLAGLGLLRRDVYIANCLKCRPDPPYGSTNRPPSKVELEDCLPFLYAQVEILDPAVILALGNTAASGLGFDEPISLIRGQVLWYRQWPVVPTWHPAYLLRSPSKDAQQQFEADIQTALKVISGA